MRLFKKAQTSSQNSYIDFIGSLNARWYSLKDSEGYASAYNEIPELNAMINYMASQFAKGKWICKDKEGELIEDDPFLVKLNRPNLIQGKNEFLKQGFIDYHVFGNEFLYFQAPKNITPESINQMFFLPARYTYPEGTGKLFGQLKIEDIIKKYVMLIRGIEYPFDIDRICHMSTDSVDFLDNQYLVGQSPLKPLAWPLSNIKVAYEARNINITRRGAFGIISYDGKAGDMGVQPMDPKDKDELQKNLKKYGLTSEQYQFIITSAQIKYNQMSIPTKDLELYKEVRESCIPIANAYRFPILLFNYLEGSTFSNLDIAHRQLYTDAIIPYAEQFTSELNRSINAEGKKYELDYTHIEALQKDKKDEAEKNKLNVDIVLEINKSIMEGSISKLEGVEILKNIVGMNEDVAQTLLKDGNKE